MKKFSEKAKAFVMAVAIVASLLLPVNSNGQTRMDGFFSSYDDDNTNRTGWDFNVTNQGFGQTNESPLGSGLIIMTIAGAGYAFLKKKED
ncbi:MAG: hypothetical protein IKS65_08195 [Bacteroidales bacterium]|nr:hypothetical protein [Bacteroidales bacterium]